MQGIGITGVGVWMIAAANADPEPSSKLGLLIGGVVVILTISFGPLAALGEVLNLSKISGGSRIYN